MHLGQQSGAEQLRQLAGIPPVRLDSYSGLDRGQRWSDDRAGDPSGAQLPLQGIAGWPGLVAAVHLSGGLALELAGQPTDGLDRGRLGPLHRLGTLREERRHLDRILVGVHPHPGDMLCAHDRLLSYAALAPQGVNPRSSVAAFPPPVCFSFARAQPYDREPVVPYCLGHAADGGRAGSPGRPPSRSLRSGTEGPVAGRAAPGCARVPAIRLIP
jgi:hypothetical protein